MFDSLQICDKIFINPHYICVSMIEDFQIITITHNDLNVDEIGYFVITHKDQEHLKERLFQIKEKFNIDELMYLSTCNRVSFIMFKESAWSPNYLIDFFKEVNPELSEENLHALNRFAKVYEGESAVKHIFEVASSVDSMVVGEREIFRQFRNAYKWCAENGLTGDNLRLLEKHTVSTAKEVYSKTKIGEKPLSIVFLAVQKLMAFQANKDARIIMIGAGETNTLMSKFLHKQGYTNAVIFNRNLDNALEISKLLNAPAYHLSEMSQYDKGFDVMIVTTSSTYSIIDMPLYQSLLNKEMGKKVIIDLSVPRNVDEEVISHFDTYYVGIEQLRVMAEENLEFRKKEVINARHVIKEKLKSFKTIFQQRKIERAMQQVPIEVRAIKEKAISTVFSKELANLDQTSQSIVIQMMDYMEKKCVSIPMKLARESILPGK